MISGNIYPSNKKGQVSLGDCSSRRMQDIYSSSERCAAPFSNEGSLSNRKVRVLFVIESLALAGAEKSLITLLSLVDYKRIDVDLQLFVNGGDLESFLPQSVHKLPLLPYMGFLRKSILCQLISMRMQKLYSRFRYSCLIRKSATSNMGKARLFWQSAKDRFQTNPVVYDVAIAYSQGIPSFYVIDKTIAKKKILWINASMFLRDTRNKRYFETYYSASDKIVLVSECAREIFSKVFPMFAPKMTVVHDIINGKLFQELSLSDPKIKFSSDRPGILTVARLNKQQKGYDISLEACKILRDRGVKFRWYAIGKGEYEPEMRHYITENHLEDHFIFLGTTPNPYPYFRSCTLYVQTSRHEGYGLSIAEARLFNKPIVTTDFDAVHMQMVDGKNGLVVPQEPSAVAEAIERLLTDRNLYNSIFEYLKEEKKGNAEEIDQFYALLENVSPQ